MDSAPNGEGTLASIEESLWTADEVQKACDVLQRSSGALRFLERYRNAGQEIIGRHQLGFAPERQAITIPVYGHDGELLNVMFHSIRKSKLKWGLKGRTTKMLYDLKSVDLTKDEIWIVLGEEEVWTATHLGLNALTINCGPALLHSVLTAVKGDIAGMHVVIVMPKTAAGEDAKARSRALFASDANVSHLRWPDDRPLGMNLSQWINTGNGVDTLQEMIKPFSLTAAINIIETAEKFLEAIDDNPIRSKVYNYYKKTKNGLKRISSFILKPKSRLTTFTQRQKSETLLVDIMSGTNVIPDVYIPKTSFGSRKRFLDTLPTSELTFTGNEVDLQNILEFVAKRDVPIKYGIDHIGMVPEYDVWSSAQGEIGRNGLSAKPMVIALPTGSVIEDRIQLVFLGEEEREPFLKKLLNLLPKVHAPEVSMTMLGWCFACFVKAWFRKEKLGGFPLLSIYGTAGGGKSSLGMLFYRTFGYAESETFSAKMTAFSAIKLLSCTTTIPIMVDEFKHDLGVDRVEFWRYLARTAYMGEGDFRGTQDLKLIQFQYRAPLVIIGEIALPNEKALIERVIPAAPSPFWLQSHEGRVAQDTFEKLKTVPLEALPPYLIPWVLTNRKHILSTMFREASDYVTKKMGKLQLPIRIAHNINVMMLGLMMARAFFDEYIEDADFREFDEKTEQSVEWVIKELTTTKAAGRSKMALDEFIEALSVMYISEKLRPGVHFVRGHDREPSIETGVIGQAGTKEVISSLIYVHFPSAYAAFCEWARQTNYRGEILDQPAYHRQIRECVKNKEYIRGMHHNRRFGEEGRMTRSLKIDLVKASQMGLEVDGFGITFEMASGEIEPGSFEPEEGEEHEPIPVQADLFEADGTAGDPDATPF